MTMLVLSNFIKSVPNQGGRGIDLVPIGIGKTLRFLVDFANYPEDYLSRWPCMFVKVWIRPNNQEQGGPAFSAPEKQVRFALEVRLPPESQSSESIFASVAGMGAVGLDLKAGDVYLTPYLPHRDSAVILTAWDLRQRYFLNLMMSHQEHIEISLDLRDSEAGDFPIVTLAVPKDPSAYKDRMDWVQKVQFGGIQNGGLLLLALPPRLGGDELGNLALYFASDKRALTSLVAQDAKGKQ